ncbi:MAG: FtsX-like permease family protein [Polyangia bacterium]
MKMAWRNLWRNRRRTVITLAGIAFGAMLAVIFTGIGDASWTAMIDLAARMGTGHVAIQHPRYRDTPAIRHCIGDVEQKLALARSDPEVSDAVARVGAHAMLATAHDSAGVRLLAVEPAKESERTLSVLEAIDAGEWLEPDQRRGIAIGAELAERLDAELGNKVVYTLTDRAGEIVSGLARVAAIVRTGSSAVDGGLAILPIEPLRELVGYAEDEATEVVVFADDQRASDAIAARLNRSLSKEAEALPWHVLQPELAGFIAAKVGGMTFFELLILVLLAAGIFNTLFVSVMERLREFGILLAIGFGPGRLRRLVLWESALIGLVGLVAAALVTAGPYAYLHSEGLDTSAMTGGGGGGSEIAGVVLDPVLRVAIFPESLAAIAAVVVLATLAAGLYPAWRAGRVVPVESIKRV